MRISTKGRYALRIMLDMAQHGESGFISLATIAERQGISKKYLDQIMLLLNRTDYFESVRGAQGGYKLAKGPEAYTVGDILRATEGGITPLACLEPEGSGCDRSNDCLARPVWQGLEEVMTRYLDSVTLRDILEAQRTG